MNIELTNEEMRVMIKQLRLNFTKEEIKEVLEDETELYIPKELRFLNNDGYIQNRRNKDMFSKELNFTKYISDSDDIFVSLLINKSGNKDKPIELRIIGDDHDTGIDALMLFNELNKLYHNGFLK